MNKAAALVLPAVLLVSLAGCFPTGGSGDDPEGDGGSGGDDLAGGPAACIIDKDWHLDLADAATKLGDELTSKGLNVQSAVGEGDQSFHFSQEGVATSSTNLTYTMVVDMGDGLVMTMAQHHEGSPGGNWAWDGSADSTVIFDGWSGDYTVTTDTSINGTSAPTSTTPTGGGLDGQSMTISCDGDTMQTQAEGSPFVQVWHAG